MAMRSEESLPGHDQNVATPAPEDGAQASSDAQQAGPATLHTDTQTLRVGSLRDYLRHLPEDAPVVIRFHASGAAEAQESTARDVQREPAEAKAIVLADAP